MKQHHERPACFIPIGPVKALAGPWHLAGVVCGQAFTPDLWRVALHHTPGCRGCCRGREDGQ